MSKCSNPDGIHRIRAAPFCPDPKKDEKENRRAFEQWKREFRVDDQFCIDCLTAIW